MKIELRVDTVKGNVVNCACAADGVGVGLIPTGRGANSVRLGGIKQGGTKYCE